MKNRWVIAHAQPLVARQLAAQLGVRPLLVQCMLNRGLTEPQAIKRFLRPRLADLSDPFQLPGMAAAVARLFDALRTNEPVVIFGDYDVDGVTSTALLLEVFRALGLRVQFYLPDRFDEGYGLSKKAVANCLDRVPAKLMVAVDCGSTATETVAWLGRRDVDVIVLDHHQVSFPPPQVRALVNPMVQAGPPIQDTQGPSLSDRPPYQPRRSTELCSVGLAFKLAHALVKHGRAVGLKAAAELDVREWLELVALGTIADVVPLTGENRILVSAGLARLNTTARPGLVALKKISQAPEPIGTYEVGFQLAPRLNAAGRLETATKALQLLLSRDAQEAESLARELDARNRERQRIEQAIADEIIHAVQARFDPGKDYVIVEGRPDWHIGVVGIVASRLVQQFHRPSIVLGGQEGQLRGSGRSIEGFDLAAALRQCADLLLQHGGHAMAAGLAIRPENLDAFRHRLNALARAALRPEQLQPLLQIDAEVNLRELDLDCVRELGLLKPFGLGNPPVRLVARALTHHRPLQRLGTDRQHVKMWVSDGTAIREAIWWGAGNELLPTGRFDLAFTPIVNEFGERLTVQLRVLDWRPAGN